MPVRRPRRRAAPKPRRHVDDWRAHALRVADGLRGLPPDAQLAHISAWIEQAEKIKERVRAAVRSVEERLRTRRLRGKTGELADELLAEASKSDAARAWLESDVGQHFVVSASTEYVARAALWESAHAAVLPDGRAAWPLANAQHLVISTGMYDIQARTRIKGTLHVGILALEALGHEHAAIARALKMHDAAQVRDTLREAGPIALEELYAPKTGPYAK